MANYIHYTQEQKDRARTTDIVDLLERQGERLKRSGKEYQWRDGSEKVTIRGNLWYHQYEEVGGDAIDFVRKFYNKNYPEAMEYLLNGYGGTLTAAPPIEQKEKAFSLPEKNDNMRRVYAYLLSRRGISRDVINAFARKQMISFALIRQLMPKSSVQASVLFLLFYPRKIPQLTLWCLFFCNSYTEKYLPLQTNTAAY